MSVPVLAQERGFQPLTQDMLDNPDPDDWLMWRGNYENWGYSPLDQINIENVSELRLAWSYAVGPGGTGMQAEPTVYDGVLYLRHPDETHSAHDAATGDVIWEFSRPLPEDFDENDPGLVRWHGGIERASGTVGAARRSKRLRENRPHIVRLCLTGLRAGLRTVMPEQ